MQHALSLKHTIFVTYMKPKDMPRQELTNKHCEHAEIPSAGQLEIWDTKIPGLGLRLSQGGRKAFVVMVRVRGLGKQRRVTLGAYPKLGLAKARIRAKEIIEDAQLGVDPREKAETERQAKAKLKRETERRNHQTFEKIAKDFIENYAKVNAPRYWRAMERSLVNHAYPFWEARPIHEISRADVRELIRSTSRTTPIAANRLLQILRKLFDWAAKEELVEASPVVGIDKPARERERERVLTDAEIRAIWNASNEKLQHPFGTLIKLLFTTAQRRNEVAGMIWDELNFDTGHWSIPGSRAKNAKGHLCPLSPLALEILKATPETGTYVISSGVRGDKPVSGFSKAKLLLDKHSGVTDWRFHDIRRTVATKIRGMGIDRVTVSKILNHSEGGITKVYDRYAAEPEKEQALRRWGEELRRIVESKPQEKVVTLTGR